MGGEDGAGSRKKEGKVTGAGRGLSEERVEDQVYASGGGQSGVRQSLPEQSLRHNGNNRSKPKKSHRKQRGGSGKSLQMALVEEERAVGAVECRLDTGRGLISLGRVAWRRVSVVRPETPSDSRKH